MSSSSLVATIIRAVRRSPACQTHHWHVNERGWSCCHGGHTLYAKRGMSPPVSTMACNQPSGSDDKDSFIAWLNRPAPIRKSLHRS